MVADDDRLFVPDLDDEISRPFWDGCAIGELRVQTCARCAQWRMPPRPMCAHCRSIEFEWIATSGRGRIWSVAVPHPPLLPGYTELAPYNVIIVELQESPLIRFVGNLVAEPGAAINSVDPSTIVIGEPVIVAFETVNEVALPRWTRAHF